MSRPTPAKPTRSPAGQGSRSQRGPGRPNNPQAPMDLDTMKQMLHSMQSRPESPNIQASFNKSSMMRVCAAICILLVFVAVAHLLVRSLKVKAVTCNTQACLTYTRILQSSLNETVNPCQDFYRYVCDGWTRQQRHSVLQDIFRKFQASVATEAAHAVAPTNVPQTPYQKAAKFYQSCENKAAGNDEVRELKKMVRESGISWPHTSDNTDVLKPILKLPTVAYLNTLFRVDLQSLHGLRGAIIQPWDCCGYILRMPKLREYTDSYEFIRNMFADDGKPSISYQDLKLLERKVAPSLLRALEDGDGGVWEGNANEISKFTPSVSIKRWKEGFNTFLNVSSGVTFLVRIVNVNFFRAFFNATATESEKAMHMYLGWFVAQSLALLINRLPCSEDFSGSHLRKDSGRLENRRFCIDTVHNAMGYALYREYVDSVATPADVRDIVKILRRIRETLFVKLHESKWSNYTVIVEVLSKDSDPALEFADKARGDYPRLLYANYSEMTNDFVENWKTGYRGLRNSRREDVIPPPFLMNGTPLYYNLKEDADDFEFTPFTLDIPVYDLQAPSAIRYGAFGTKAASALAELFFRTRGGWTSDMVAEMDTLIQCFFGKGRTLASVYGQELDQLYSAVTLGAVWMAYQASDGTKIEKLAQKPNFSTEQMFFIFWCYMQCNTKESQEQCNMPLRHTSYFSRVFMCPQDSPMSQKNPCKVFSV